METGRKRIRKDFAPLSVSVTLACATQFSPVTQVFNARTGEYDPNRTVTPTVLQPTVIANAPDGSWPNPHSNALLANMVWKVNGVDITTINSWNNLYEIDTVGATRGALTIFRNLLPSERFSLTFEAELVDSRLGTTHPVKTDPIVLSTVDSSDDSYGISIDESKAIYYNPFKDKLHLYEYQVAHGIISASAAARAAALDENAYLRTIPVTVYRGAEKMTSGYTLKLYEINNVNSMTELTAGNEVVSIAASSIVMDLRIIRKANYMIKVFVGNTEVARCQFSVSRLHQDFSCNPTNGTGILPHQTERYDEAMVDSEGKAVVNPESIISIVWFTDSAHATNVRHNEGGHTVFELAKTGIGSTADDDWLEVFTDAIQKGPYDIAIDGNNEVYTDGNNEPYIIN